MRYILIFLILTSCSNDEREKNNLIKEKKTNFKTDVEHSITLSNKLLNKLKKNDLNSDSVPKLDFSNIDKEKMLIEELIIRSKRKMDSLFPN